MKRTLLPILFFLILPCCYAQLTETQGWFFLSHQQKITGKIDLLADVQTRSANEFAYFNTLLLRGAFSYNFSKKHSAALGYAFKKDWEREDGSVERTIERRIYQQYIFQSKIKKVEMMYRARFEQRWIKEQGETDFSMRGRAFISAQIPLLADSAFSKGLYTGIQDELFLNVQNKQAVNGSLFDQNRAFLSIGYRWSKHVDSEIGYMFWYQKEKDNSFRRNVIQLMLTTSL